ncbi:TPA: hypothetical protein JBL19_06290 [Legionella pneumophila]|nr:hypothetical protein [Legionella pneumophila subsp. fraseri]HAT1796315.1 hypothetical protein [Legionella pneumophila]MDW8961457.1 hypothetical protein [Legionella pneumophila subsp. fraseri]MDW9036266.1 hypothetical protein [Legionella pneumophila subsp. fraseri]MDW9038977.1 hypothetical protein [Legionella pneumophila subsp. fraseri]
MLLKQIDFFEDIFPAYPKQREFFAAFFSGLYRFFMENVHRRFGKDAEFFNLAWLVASMTRGNYLYTLPKIGQAKNVIWEGTDLEGRRWIDLIPKHLLAREPNQSERKLYFTSGSMLHVTGADSILGAHLGSNLRGLFMSEFQRTAPYVWDYLRPIINRSKGFACFNYTSFGQCHAHRLRIANLENPQWHCRKLTVNDTRDNEGNYIFSPEQIEDERKSGMDEDLIQQEYYCDDSVAVKGTYFAEHIQKARAEGRIVPSLEIYPSKPVHTSWDLGSKDTNSIWFFQVIGTGENQQFRYFYQHDQNYKDIDYYLALLTRIRIQYGFSTYGHHFLPHDVSQTEWTSGKTRLVILLQKGLKITQVPRLRVIERVQVARSNLHKCWFAEKECRHGIEALETSRAKYDEKLKAFSADEVHDWASHPSAAFQYGHVGWLDSYNKTQLAQQKDYAKYRPMG